MDRVSNNVSPDLTVTDENSSKSLEQKQNQSFEQIDEAKNSEQIGQAAAYNLRNRELLKPPNRTTFDEPTAFTEAITGENADRWKTVISEKLEAHAKNNTWTLVQPPKNGNIIKCKGFKIKENSTESDIRFKARLCAKGFSQKAGFNYTETFSPVVRYDSIRILLTIAACKNQELSQFDIKTAFINGTLSEEIYMQLPESIDTRNDRMVCKLNKALYGLK